MPSKARKKRRSPAGRVCLVLFLIALLVGGLAFAYKQFISPDEPAETAADAPISLDEIPAYSGEPYIAINGNRPFFTADELTAASYETYAELDGLGRCGVAVASIGRDLMPDEDRGSIGQVKPSGWATVKYDFVDGKYLYNRCHLIGFQLTGENANEKNLITGTRYLNIKGMLPFENMVADYIKETGNHVLYRVTPIFHGNDLVASGVLMEAQSVEDNGDGILFNVYCYNVQPGVVIDYADGSSYAAGTTPEAETAAETEPPVYVINTDSKKFHDSNCRFAKSLSEDKKEVSTGDREELIQEGYEPCGSCKP